MIGKPGTRAARRTRSAPASGLSTALTARLRAFCARAPACWRARAGASANLREQALELAEQVVGLIPPAGDQSADHLIRVAAGHAAAPHGVVDHLLEAVAGDRDALLEGVAERLHALLGA